MRNNAKMKRIRFRNSVGKKQERGNGNSCIRREGVGRRVHIAALDPDMCGKASRKSGRLSGRRISKGGGLLAGRVAAWHAGFIS